MKKESEVYIFKNIRNKLHFFRLWSKKLITTIIFKILSIVPTIFIYKFINQLFY